MKPNFHLLRLFLAGAILSLIAPFAHAGPGPQHWKAITDEAQIKKLQVGDKVAFVCNQCKTISEIPIQSPAHARSLRKDGATASLPRCKHIIKVIVKGSRSDPTGARDVVTFVNEKGEECGFLAAPSP